MAPRHVDFRRLKQRMSRRLCYGGRRMDSLNLPLSEMVVDYFDEFAPFDYLDIRFATSLSRDGCIDPCTLLVALVYMDRVRLTDRPLFESSDPADLYLSSLVVAGKFLQDSGLDEYIHNDEWAASAETSLQRVNQLEVQLLKSLQWNLMVTKEQFEACLARVEIAVAMRVWQRTGISTYNELSVLENGNLLWHKGILPFISLIGVVSAVYAAAVVTLTIVPMTVSSLAIINADLMRFRMEHAWIVKNETVEVQGNLVHARVYSPVASATSRGEKMFDRERMLMFDRNRSVICA